MAYKFLNLMHLPANERQLLDHADFFSSYAWYKNLISTVFTANQSPFLNCTVNKHSLLLPLNSTLSFWGYRTLASLSNYYSPLYQPLYNDGTALPHFLHTLKTIKPQWDCLLLQPMSVEQVHALKQAAHIANLPSIEFFCFGNWFLELNTLNFEQYFAQRASRVQNTVTRKRKQFQRLANTRIHIFTERDELQQASADFTRVYQLSWKKPEPHPDFIPGLIRTAAEKKALRLAIAYLDNKPIAAQFWIVADNTAYIYKLAYDQHYKKLSIGSVLTATLMQHVIDIDKVSVIDYLSGDDRYKKEWMSHRRERKGLIIFNTTLRGRLALCYHKAKRCFKKGSAINPH